MGYVRGLSVVDFPAAAEFSVGKVALLGESLGVEGYFVYATLVIDTKEAYDDVVQHLADHCERKPSLIF